MKTKNFFVVRAFRCLLVVLVFFPGCEEEEEATRMVSEREIQALEDEITQSAKNNQQRACLRPLLRGEPLEGSAEADMVAIIEGEEATRACRQILAKRSEEISEALCLPDDQGPDGFPRRASCTARALDARAGDELLHSLCASCAPLIERMRKAVRHRDACSPYLPGRRGSGDQVWLIRAAHAQCAAARARMAAGEMSEAAELLLDAFRLDQDFIRGGTSLLQAKIVYAASVRKVPFLELLLNDSRPLGEKLLGQIQSELTVLMETETHPSDLLRGEAEAVVLYTILPPLKVLPFEQAGQGAHPAPLSAQESDWSPPGGWGTGDPRSEGIQEHGPRETQSIEERDEWALIWLAYREQSREWAGRCPRNRPPEACVAGMRTWAEELRRLSGERSHWSFLARLTRAGDRAERLREKSTRFLAELADHPFDEDIARQGTVRFYLAALRLHAAYRALAEERGACPDASAFDAAPLSALRIDPYSGKPIRVQALSPGRFALLPHDGKNPAESVEPPPAVFIRCDPNAFRQ